MQYLLLLLALHFAPPTSIPGWTETISQRYTRYASIAEDITYTVAKRGAFRGLNEKDSATLMLAVAIGESGLAPDTDWGPCYNKGAFRSRCDGGRAVGISQTHVHEGDRDRFFFNRRLHLALAHRRMGASLSSCWRLPMKHRLAAYGSGSCDRGRKGSASRMALFRSLVRKRFLLEKHVGK